MAIGLMNFPILSFEQANPGLAGADLMQKIYSQALQNQYYPQQTMADIAVKQAEARFMPQILQAEIGQKQAQAGLAGAEAGKAGAESDITRYKYGMMLHPSTNDYLGPQSYGTEPTLGASSGMAASSAASNLPFSPAQTQKLQQLFGRPAPFLGADGGGSGGGGDGGLAAQDSSAPSLAEKLGHEIGAYSPDYAQWARKKAIFDASPLLQRNQAMAKLQADAPRLTQIYGPEYVNMMSHMIDQKYSAAQGEEDSNKEQIKDFNIAGNAAAKIKSQIKQIEEILQEIPSAYLGPMAGKVSPYWDSRIQTLHTMQQNLMATLNELNNVPARGWNMKEMANMAATAGSPVQKKDAIYRALYGLEQNSNTILANKQNAQDYLGENKTLSRFSPATEPAFNASDLMEQAKQNPEKAEAILPMLTTTQLHQLALQDPVFAKSFFNKLDPEKRNRLRNYDAQFKGAN